MVICIALQVQMTMDYVEEFTVFTVICRLGPFDHTQIVSTKKAAIGLYCINHNGNKAV